METRIPQIITASSKLSSDLAERIHLLTPSKLTNTSTALILPSWPAYLEKIRLKMSRTSPIKTTCPMLSINISATLLKSLEKRYHKEYRAAVYSCEHAFEKGSEQVDVLVFHFDINGESITLLFDIKDESTNKALRYWMSLGFIPANVNSNGRGAVLRMPLNKRFAHTLEPGLRGLTSASFERFFVCVKLDQTETINSLLPPNRVTMLVATPESLPSALGLCTHPIYLDGVLVGEAGVELLIP